MTRSFQGATNITVVSLPMRDGNQGWRPMANSAGGVVSLPMRDGNFFLSQSRILRKKLLAYL